MSSFVQTSLHSWRHMFVGGGKIFHLRRGCVRNGQYNCQNEGELGENLGGFAEVTGGNRLYRERGRNLNICVSSNHGGKQALRKGCVKMGRKFCPNLGELRGLCRSQGGEQAVQGTGKEFVDMCFLNVVKLKRISIKSGGETGCRGNGGLDA